MSLLKKICILVCVAMFTGAPSCLSAQEPAVNAMSKAADLGTTLVEKVKLAVNGNEDAGRELIDQYLVPAALALILLIIGYLFASFMGRIIGNSVTRRVDKTIGKFSGKMVQNCIMVLVLLGALGYFGIDVTSFAAILAAAGFAVGMALQGTLSNFAAGIMLLVFRPFQVDDYIKVGDTEGAVEEIDLFTTKLNTPDNKHVIVPNSNVFGVTMINYSRNSSRRVEVNVGVAYDADTKFTRQILEQAISSIPLALDIPDNQVVLVELGDSAVNWQCRVWCAPENYWPVKESVTEAVKNALDNAHISIPFPQMDINVAGKLFAKAA